MTRRRSAVRIRFVDVTQLSEEVTALRENVQRLTTTNEKLAAEREQYRQLYLQMLEQKRQTGATA